MASQTAPVQPPGRRSLVQRLVVLALAVAAATVLVVRYHPHLRIEALAARETALREAVAKRPVESLAIAFITYVAVTGLALPGATAMSVACGWLFGFWRALVLVSFASTTGATLAFLLSRYLVGNWVQVRYGGHLRALNAAIDREGAFYLFTLRLLVHVPFFVVNSVMGLTRMPVWTFWWVSQIGMLPATILFVLAGASAPSLQDVAEHGLGRLLDWRLIGAFVLIGLLPLAVKWTLGWAGARRQM